jgi:predicted phosphodiesterase
MKFDVISDIHLEDTFNGQTMESFVARILPENPSELLVFAGDFGYFNDDNISFLTELKKYYPYILYVLGNNDIKISNKNPEGFHDAKERVLNFKKRADALGGVFHLDGRTFTFKGYTFGGCDLFYDFDEIKLHLKLNDGAILDEWKKRKLDFKHRGWIDDPKLFAEEEKQKLRHILPQSDIIVTHGPPNYFVANHDQTMGFYRFEGGEFQQKIHYKVWIFGHQHQRRWETKYGCLFVNPSYMDEENPVILTINLTSKEGKSTWT